MGKGAMRRRMHGTKNLWLNPARQALLDRAAAAWPDRSRSEVMFEALRELIARPEADYVEIAPELPSGSKRTTDQAVLYTTPERELLVLEARRQYPDLPDVVIMFGALGAKLNGAGTTGLGGTDQDTEAADER